MMPDLMPLLFGGALLLKRAKTYLSLHYNHRAYNTYIYILAFPGDAYHSPHNYLMTDLLFGDDD